MAKVKGTNKRIKAKISHSKRGNQHGRGVRRRKHRG